MRISRCVTMADMNPKLKRKLRQAQSTADNNKRSAAVQLFQEILDEDPEIADAWVGLGSMMSDVVEQKAAYQRALTIDPQHKGAIRALAILNGEAVPDEAALPEDDVSGLEEAPPVEAEPLAWPEEKTVEERFDAVENVQEANMVEDVHDHEELAVAADGLVLLSTWQRDQSALL